MIRGDDDAVLGALLAVIREQRGMTQAELGARARLTQSKISRIEAGRRALPARDLLAICGELEVSVDRVAALGRRAAKLSAAMYEAAPASFGPHVASVAAWAAVNEEAGRG